jgi:hypothetical protein
MKVLVILGFIFFVSGCAITNIAEPAVELKPYQGTICLIENPAVRAEFIESYKSLLVKKGFTPELIPAGSALNSCEVTSTYIGKWSWDFVAYMATAEIKVYKNGALIGEATYASPRGGWSLTAKIYEETSVKISGMVENLFP